MVAVGTVCSELPSNVECEAGHLSTLYANLSSPGFLQETVSVLLPPVRILLFPVNRVMREAAQFKMALFA